MRIGLLLTIVLLTFTCISNDAAAQGCMTGADVDCDMAVNITELMGYIRAWYQCSSCIPDVFQSIQAFYGIPFCSDHICDAGAGENCSSCEPDCGCGSGYVCQSGSCLAITGNAIYVDNFLTTDCPGTYSIADRNCSGIDGYAYDSIVDAAGISAAGDTVFIREGTHFLNERVYISNKAGTGESSGIIFTNFNLEDVVIDGSGSGATDWRYGINIENSSYVVLDGLKFRFYHESVIRYADSDFGEIRNVLIENGGRGGIGLSNSHHTIIDYVTIRNTSIEAGKNGILVRISNHTNITNSYIHEHQGRGINLFGASHCFVDRNEISNVSGGILTSYDDSALALATHNKITNNLIHDNILDPENTDGISISTGSRNNTVAGNVVYNNADDGIDASTRQGASGISCNLYATITNNIAFNSGYGAAGDGNGIKVSTNCGGGHLVANNIVFGNRRAGFDQDKALGHPNNLFYNNIAYGNGIDAGSNMHSGFVMDAYSLPQDEDAVIYNNIAANNAARDLHRSNELAVQDSDYNLWGDGDFVSGMDQNSLSGDPMFNNSGLVVDTNFDPDWSIDEKLGYIRNQVREKFCLQFGSPAIDNGTIIPGYHCPASGETGDCVTWYGSAPDIGAYQHAEIDAPNISMTDNISQYNITWTFDSPTHYGQFANGDYWVVGPVNIIAKSPAPNGTGTGYRHGSMVNPLGIDNTQAYDGRGAVFDESKAVSFPYTLQPGESIISAVSRPEDIPPVGERGKISDAAVLTAMASPPPAGSFRPPFCGTNKPLHNVADLREYLLPSLDPVPSTPRLTMLPTDAQADSVERMFQRPWPDHTREWFGQHIHPLNHMRAYGRDIAQQITIGALMLMLDESQVGDKTQLLIYYVQLGIDHFGVVESGGFWSNNGGHATGNKWPILFAGIMLDDDPMRDIGLRSGDYINSGSYDAFNLPPDYVNFAEDDQTFYVSMLDVNATNGPTWNPDYRDAEMIPYEVSDIGLPEWGIVHAGGPDRSNKYWLTVYRLGTTGMTWAGFILAAQIMGARDLWNHDSIFDYLDRYANITADNGAWPGWGLRPFEEEMWDAYRNDYGCVWTMDDTSDAYSYGHYVCGPDTVVCASAAACNEYPSQRACDYDPCNLGCGGSC